jgi:hypothetical protein
MDAETAAGVVVLGLAAIMLTAMRLPWWQVVLILALIAALGFGFEAFLDSLVGEG